MWQAAPKVPRNWQADRVLESAEVQSRWAEWRAPPKAPRNCQAYTNSESAEVECRRATDPPLAGSNWRDSGPENRDWRLQEKLNPR
jgi:hypothetical protein